MDRAREALLRAQFKSKGKWYLAQQVDAFLVEEDARDGEALSEAMRTLGKENQQLKAQLEEAQSARSRQGEEESRRRVCQELERERDGLIQDIKDLRAYREEFRKAVAKEAQDLLGQVEGLPSKTLL